MKSLIYVILIGFIATIGCSEQSISPEMLQGGLKQKPITKDLSLCMAPSHKFGPYEYKPGYNTQIELKKMLKENPLLMQLMDDGLLGGFEFFKAVPLRGYMQKKIGVYALWYQTSIPDKGKPYVFQERNVKLYPNDKHDKTHTTIVELIVGERKLKSIDKITEPQDVDRYTVRKVFFTYTNEETIYGKYLLGNDLKNKVFEGEAFFTLKDGRWNLNPRDIRLKFMKNKDWTDSPFFQF